VLLGEPGIAVGVPGIGGKVRLVVELGRVHEKRDNERVALGAEEIHQSQVALVEEAQGREQAHRAAVELSRPDKRLGQLHRSISPFRLARMAVASAMSRYCSPTDSETRRAAASWPATVEMSPLAIGPVRGDSASIS